MDKHASRRTDIHIQKTKLVIICLAFKYGKHFYIVELEYAWPITKRGMD